jgi:hypothetical protein
VEGDGVSRDEYPEVMVEIRCKSRGCGKLLKQVTEPPADWSGVVRVRPPCPRHHGNVRPEGDTARIQRRHIAMARASAKQGLPGLRLTIAIDVPAEALREPIAKYWRTATTQVLTV